MNMHSFGDAFKSDDTSSSKGADKHQGQQPLGIPLRDALLNLDTSSSKGADKHQGQQ